MNFDPQTAFRKQPMVYVSIVFITGILFNKIFNTTRIAPIIIGNLFIWYLIARKSKYSYLLIVITGAQTGKYSTIFSELRDMYRTELF